MTEGVVAIKDNRNDDQNKKAAKTPGVFGFFKAAMFVLRHRTKGKQKAAQVITQQGDWKKLVGSMRPLHLQDNNNNTLYCATSPSAASQYASTDDLKSLDQLDNMSQYASANDLKSLDALASASASSGTMSQYASANNLQDLDEQEEEEDDPDKVFDAIGADDMIDAKAELFILQFYQQMRRQNVDSISGQFH
ncbi:uncharacterized protein LOC125807977 [Solanum verrucosum]|uniref:uncharacterized protein LOC125807977 n=1 Tax=Solanum verrucosum TaxID=315347 RepID=UPI0020D05A58|nr:uncharacterized protein LOC125807977 [Solanum verrucosum]